MHGSLRKFFPMTCFEGSPSNGSPPKVESSSMPKRQDSHFLCFYLHVVLGCSKLANFDQTYKKIITFSTPNLFNRIHHEVYVDSA